MQISLFIIQVYILHNMAGFTAILDTHGIRNSSITLWAYCTYPG